MKLDRFLEEREPGWTGLEELLREAGAKPERLGPERLRRLGSLYRAAAADLAFARRAFPHDPVTRRLERLVVDARQAVYADAGARRSLRWFLTRGYWQRVRERPWALAAALLMLFGPMALAAVWAIDDPAAAIGVVPAEFQGAAEPGGGTRQPQRRRPGGALERDLHQQHPRHVPGDRGRDPRRARDRGGDDLQRRLHRRDRRADDRERLERRAAAASSSRTACSSSRASRSPRAPGCGSAGRSSIRGR